VPLVATGRPKTPRRVDRPGAPATGQAGPPMPANPRPALEWRARPGTTPAPTAGGNQHNQSGWGRNAARLMVRILIVDEQDLVRLGIRRIVRGQPGLEVVGEASDGHEAVARAIKTKPDVILLEYLLPSISGLEVVRQLKQHQPLCEFLLFTMHDNEVLMEQALKAGVRGYVLKSDPGRDLIAAITALGAHQPFFTNKVSQLLLEALLALPDASSNITSRQRCIVQLIAEGYQTKQIAKILGIGLKTVETHRAHIMHRLALTSSAALVRYAIRARLAEA
jgi:DNA-binding NarL/FixJ family response regulator